MIWGPHLESPCFKEMKLPCGPDKLYAATYSRVYCPMAVGTALSISQCQSLNPHCCLQSVSGKRAGTGSPLRPLEVQCPTGSSWACLDPDGGLPLTVPSTASAMEGLWHTRWTFARQGRILDPSGTSGRPATGSVLHVWASRYSRPYFISK